PGDPDRRLHVLAGAELPRRRVLEPHRHVLARAPGVAVAGRHRALPAAGGVAGAALVARGVVPGRRRGGDRLPDRALPGVDAPLGARLHAVRRAVLDRAPDRAAPPPPAVVGAAG